MKRKYKKINKKLVLQKKSLNLSLDSYFKVSSKKYKTTPYKRSPSPILNVLNSNESNLCIIRNPSKTHLLNESKQELKKYHNRAERTILCDNKIIDILCNKLNSSFEKINRYLVNNKKFKYNNNINQKDLITKFLLQLKYTDISYISPVFLSENFNEEKISQNLKNFIGYNNLKSIKANFLPKNIKECQIFWPTITEIITNYFNNFHEGTGLFVYIKHDYLSYLNKIKLLCNLFNYETSVIDESNQNKGMILDKLSEAMQTKRLPSISENLGAQILMLEEMVNSFSYKWEIFSKNLDQNKKNNIINNNNTFSTNNNNNKSNDLNYFDNNISSISINSSSSGLSNNDKINLTNKDLSVIYEEFDLKRKESSSKMNDNINNNDDIVIKLDSSTSETYYMNFKGRKNNSNRKIEDIKYIEQNKLLLSKKEKTKITDKSKDKNSKNNTSNKLRNKSNEYKKRKNKKSDSDINNTDIKGYFRENTKEHKIFTQLQNNIFLYCTKSKTAIIIVDTFSDKDIDKKYFNNILLKISQTRCPIIVLTNNLDYLYTSQPKKIKNLNINCILSANNKKDINIIHLYIFIIYLNVKLCSLKFTKNIKTYEQLLEYINNNIDKDTINYELCFTNLKYIYNLSEYICHYGKFQIDVIDLRLSEIFSEVEKEINSHNLSSNDFNNIIEYIYNKVFPDKIDIYNDTEEEKSIEELYSECEIKSFMDYSEGIKDKLIDKYYKEKLNLNDSYKNYLNSKDSMVNLEGLILEKYFNYNSNFIPHNDNNKEKNLILYKSYSFNDTFNNKLINKIHKADQLYISYIKKRFITIPSLYNYVYPINRMLIIKRNSFNNYINKFNNIFRNKISDINSIFIDVHVFKKIFQKIENDYFFNKSNLNYASNHLLKKSINQRKINVSFYEK